MVIRPILWKKPRKDGKHNIKIYLYKDAKDKKYITTPHFVLPNEWSDDKWVKKHRINSEAINADLREKVSEIEKKFISQQNASTSQVIKQKGALPLSQFLSEYEKELTKGKTAGKKGQPLSSGYIRTFRNSIRKILDFLSEHPYNYNEVDGEFYNEFLYWCRFEKEWGDNYIGILVKNLKKLMTIARKRKYHNNTEFEDFAGLAEEADNIALTEEEIETMFNVELSPSLEFERDRFFVAYNFLLRFTDSISIDELDIIKDGKEYFLSTIPSKTKDRVVIPVFDRTLQILKKYDYKLPTTSTKESNRKLKIIGEKAGIKEKITVTKMRRGKLIKERFPKHELITTHTSRRSMATNLWKNGFDLPEIMLMGGWKSLVQLQKYLKIDKMDNAKKAAKHPFFQR